MNKWWIWILMVSLGIGYFLFRERVTNGRNAVSRQSFTNPTEAGADSGRAQVTEIQPETEVQAPDTGVSPAARERDELIALYPNKYFDPDNKSLPYQFNLLRHHEISKYVKNPIRDAESMQKLMILLLENGYDVVDWNHAVNMLTFYGITTRLRKQNLTDAGMSPDAIDQWLSETHFYESHPNLKAVREGFMQASGIQEGALLDAILTLDIPEEALEERLADPYTTIKGDRLLTDEDWLTEEFKEARSKYQGPPRRTAAPGMQIMQPGPGQNETDDVR